MLRGDGLGQDVRVEFDHVVAVTADGADVAAFFAAFGAGEVFGGEERGGGWGAAEYDVGFSHVFF